MIPEGEKYHEILKGIKKKGFWKYSLEGFLDLNPNFDDFDIFLERRIGDNEGGKIFGNSEDLHLGTVNTICLLGKSYNADYQRIICKIVENYDNGFPMLYKKHLVDSLKLLLNSALEYGCYDVVSAIGKKMGGIRKAIQGTSYKDYKAHDFIENALKYRSDGVIDFITSVLQMEIKDDNIKYLENSKDEFAKTLLVEIHGYQFDKKVMESTHNFEQEKILANQQQDLVTAFPKATDGFYCIDEVDEESETEEESVPPRIRGARLSHTSDAADRVEELFSEHDSSALSPPGAKLSPYGPDSSGLVETSVSVHKR